MYRRIRITVDSSTVFILHACYSHNNGDVVMYVHVHVYVYVFIIDLISFFFFQSSSGLGWYHEGPGPQRWTIVCPNQLPSGQQARGNLRVNH